MKKILLFLLVLLITSTAIGQTVATYSFSQSLGTFTAITGGTVLGTGSFDDNNYNANPIGFTFTFNGTGYTTFSVNANGFLCMGSTVFSSYTPLSSGSSNNVVSILARDLQGLSANGELRYEVLGSSPTRTLVVQWLHMRKYGASGDDWNFQIRLNETSNTIDLVYGSFTTNTSSTTVQVGLRGASNADFNNRATTTNWAATTAGASNSASCTLSNTVFPASGQTFTFTPPVPCSGTPAPGNTVASSNPACSGVNFTLSLQNTTPGTGLTYQWQSSPDGTTWTNVGTSTPTYTTSQTTATYYRCQVTCSGNTGTSNPLQVTMSPFYNCYCASYSTYTGDEDIFNVTVGTLNNTSDCSTLAPGPGSVVQIYSNYYGYVTVPDLKRTTVQTFSVQIGTCGGNYSNAIKIFIDYNQNGSFADAGEEVFVSGSSTSGPHTETGSFTIPGTAIIGNTRMRVVNVETGSPGSITPCGTYGWGETEDYAVNIFDVPGVTTDAATAITGTTATLNGTVSANGASTTVTFEWGTMTGPPFNNTVTLPGSVTGQNIAVNAPITSLQPNTTYYFRSIGTNSAGTTNGTVLSFTTSMIAPAITTNNATVVGATFATLNGTATAYNATTTVTFEYGTTPGGPYPNPVTGIPPTVTGNTATAFYAPITGLVINTNYYYRAIGISGGGTTYGLEKTFYTTCVVPPTPGTISGPSQVCKTGTGYVYSVSQVPYGFYYNWTFPSGFTITSYIHSNSVTVDVSNTAVSGTISVIAVSDCGAPSSPSTMAVTVNNLPVPTVSGPSPVCQSVTNTYSTQPGMTSYQWSVSPDGTITPTANPDVVTINWPTTGSKTVGVIYTTPSTGCTAGAPGTLPVTVNAAPVPTINGSANLCVNSGFYNYSTESGQSNYAWTISSGGTITFGQGTATIEVTWNTPGAQFVTVNYNNVNNCPAQSPTVYNVTVDGPPGPAGTISGSSNVCYNYTNAPYSVAPIVNTVYYVWTLPAGATIASGAGTNSITVDFTNASSGNITVYGNSLCGNGAVSPPLAVTITQLPGAAGTVNGPGSVCEGETGVAFSIPPVTGATGYKWTLPTGATIVSGDNTPNITVDFAMDASSGVITVYGTNFCGNGQASPDFSVTVVKKPAAPVITLNGDVLSSDIADGNQWYYNGAPITGATEQTLIALYDGWYWDIVIVNGCISDTSNNIYVNVTGVDEPVNSRFVVYPVPNDGRFTLQMFTINEESFDVTVYNSIGSSVYTKKDIPVKGQTDLTIDLRPVPTGIYTVVLRNSEHRIIRKIMINK